MTATIDIPGRADVPVDERWDLSTIFLDDDAWTEGVDGVRPAMATAAGHRGHLGDSARRLRQALDDAMALHVLIERLFVYAKLKADEDTRDTAGQARLDQITALSIEAGETLAFTDPEILAIPADRLDSMVTDPLLETYRHLLDDLERHRPHTRSTEIEELLAQSADIARIPRDVFNVLDNADLEFGTVADDTGQQITLTKGRAQLLLESKNRDVRRSVYQTMLSAYRDHRHTLAALHAGTVRKDVFYARAHNHTSARGAALFASNVPETVYDSLIEATRAARPAMQRYNDLRKRMLGLDELSTYDLYVPLGPKPESQYEYRDGVDLVLNGLAKLGDGYVADLRHGFASRWVDVRETRGKRSGAYSWGAYGAPPVMLLNWNGSLDAVFTLAHEAGHAMHSYYADAAQPFHKAQYSIFLAEIASTINEVLLTWHLLAETPADDVAERFSLLNRFADGIVVTLARQAMFAEFEQRTHAAVEAGEPLTLDTLTGLYAELMTAYLPGVTVDELSPLNWSRIPHFYGGFYVYQYATGISAAIALAGQIRDEGEPAARRYLEMLEAGGSDYSLPILQRAGVDLTTPEPVRAALAEFEAAVIELESLAESGQLQAAA